MKKLPLVLTAIGAVGVGFLVIFVTFIQGTTNGPDLIVELQSGKLASSAIESIEVVVPMDGSTPFNSDEYSRLERRAIINDRKDIGLISEYFSKAERGNIQMNHPVVNDVCYLRINTNSGFYWVYCTLLEDERYRILGIKANTRNAMNPNGSESYSQAITDDLLETLGGKRLAEQAGKGTRR